MNKTRDANGFGLLGAVAAFLFLLVGCSGDNGSQGPTGPAGAPGGSSPSTATALTITITGVTIHSAPVVDFTVANEAGTPIVGIADGDLRFNIAKLTPGTNGEPSKWQNYINRASGVAVQGSQERFRSGFPWGTLVSHGDGSYTYTFATDITSATANPCPATPCNDADGKALDISYQPNLTHRVGIQQGNSAYPKANATFDFVPAGGAVSTTREIVETANCNQCHNQLVAHGSRIETKLCVTCHNPGSWIAGTPNTTVDFKVYIHKIHRGEELPSVVAGTPYKIGSADFSDVVFPQDIRNCTKCHNGADTNTAQGDNWETHPSIQACGSCHDDVYFGLTPDPAKPYQTKAHPGGVVTDNSECLTCHATNRIAGSIAESHAIPQKVAGAKFKYNIESVTGGATPSITFSVTDPTNSNAKYDITTDPAFTTTAGGLSRLAIDVGWNTRDLNNEGSGANPAQPISVNPVSTCGGPGTPTADWTCTAASGSYTLTKQTALPTAAVGTGRFGIEGHPAAPSDPVNAPSVYDMRVPVQSVVADFAITDAKAVARRTVVDVAKCDKCHDVLSLHGDNRVNEPQLCVICHNPNDTDIGQRPGGTTLDGKKEEAIDFKRMIHAIHAGAATKYDGTAAHGFREKGLVVYGFGGSTNDFSDTRFPGILNDCTTCHAGTSYQLTGIWEQPAQNGILGSTIDTGVSLADPADDLNISPTAAVCSSCHDDAVAQSHMQLQGGLFGVVQSPTIDANVESCEVCHGSGKDFDVVKVHGL
jgi:OmcA/MtrC family decaheme c-type cytochrome